MSGVLSDNGDSEGSFGVGGTESPYFALDSEPGDIVMFRGGLYHASYGGGDHRRMFTLNFAARPRHADEVKFHKDLYQKHLGWVRDDLYRPRSYVYGDEFFNGGGARASSVDPAVARVGVRMIEGASLVAEPRPLQPTRTDKGGVAP